MIFKEQLKAINACEEALNWVKDKTLQEAFTTCERADWMLWAYARLYPDNLRELTLAKGHCANTIRNLMKDERSIKAIDTAIQFGEGKISREELDAAADAARDAADAAAAAYAAAAATVAYAATVAAAYAAAHDAARDAYTAYTAAATVAAAYAAASSAATRVSARKQSLKEQADICRKYLTI
jgi:hypothetical protein